MYQLTPLHFFDQEQHRKSVQQTRQYARGQLQRLRTARCALTLLKDAQTEADWREQINYFIEEGFHRFEVLKKCNPVLRYGDVRSYAYRNVLDLVCDSTSFFAALERRIDLLFEMFENELMAEARFRCSKR